VIFIKPETIPLCPVEAALLDKGSGAKLVEHWPATSCVVGLDPCRRRPQGVVVDFGPKQFGWLPNQLGNPSSRSAVTDAGILNYCESETRGCRTQLSSIQRQVSTTSWSPQMQPTLWMRLALNLIKAALRNVITSWKHRA
jgi:hypothetical protein